MHIQDSEPVLACVLSAIPKEMRSSHESNAQRIFGAVQEVQELPTGYALRLPNEMEFLQTVVEFIRYERLCCPFFRFTLEIEPEEGPFWLKLTGVVDVKEFLREQGLVNRAPTGGHA